MKIQKLITYALSLSNNAISYHVSQELAAIYPKKALLESNDSSFNLEKYAEANLCKIKYDNHIHNQMRKVFKQARQSAPCVLVLEDIDSLLNDENRSFFLNELDGFASNQGIVTIATTNHPERLDSAISERPSRFDRKYHFDLPAFPEREAYITLWNDKLKSAMGLSEQAVSQIVELTEGFSFAYLKELFLSSMICWMGAMETGSLDKIMISQVAILREQMSSTTVSSKDSSYS
jgi:AAA+ superfamily predicted ATPase